MTSPNPDPDAAPPGLLPAAGGFFTLLAAATFAGLGELPDHLTKIVGGTFLAFALYLTTAALAAYRRKHPMTGPGPDTDLDNTLGINQLPPATITDTHRAEAARLLSSPVDGAVWRERVAQAIADAEKRAVARHIAEHEAAGGPA